MELIHLCDSGASSLVDLPGIGGRGEERLDTETSSDNPGRRKRGEGKRRKEKFYIDGI